MPRSGFGSDLGRTVLVCVLALSACRSSGADVSPAYGPRVGGSPPAASSPFSEVAEARGIPPLSSVALPDGSREIRLTDSYGMVAGREIPMLRIVESPSGVSGELIFFWAESAPTSTVPDGCVRWRQDMATCVRVADSDIDWPTVAAELDRLGAWTLTESCRSRTDFQSVADAGDLLVQRLEGERFESYRCNAPRLRTGTEAGRRSSELWRYLLSWSRQ